MAPRETAHNADTEQNTGAGQPILIFDADDTLWENEAFYRRCIRAVAERMAELGFDFEEAEHTIESVERERVPLVGYAPEEFSRSLVIAYQRLCQQHGGTVDDEVSDAIWEIGQAVVDYPILLLAGVADTLPQLHGRCRMLLLTKGAQQTQERKLARSGLGHFFEAVHVVPEKSDKVIRELVAYYRLSPEQTWVVGNSPRSDINPALEAGVRAVYIPHSSTWELEQEEIPHSERVIQLRSFRELAALFLEGG